jgi:ZIP family zinc transporter
MSDEFLSIITIAAAAGLASPIGGLIALWRTPTSLFMSVSLGFASGVLLGTIGFEMLPKALELGSWSVAVGGFVGGFSAVYGLDLFVHRGKLAGEKAEQHGKVERFYHKHRPRGGEVTVLAGGTSAEELIEGLSIGVGILIEPGLGLLIALAIVIDNFSEGLSIGEIIRSEKSLRRQSETWRILGWTGMIGAAVLASTLIGWFFLRGLAPPILAFLFGSGAGGMFYLTVTDLVPQAEERQYQQAAAVAMGAGFMVMFVLSTFL